MDVIGAGFGRTGTLSLKVALEQLGLGPCLHMVPLLEDPERSALFRKAAEGDIDSLPLAIDGFRSTVDWPGTYFWRDLVARYPGAKVVLTVRDPGKWYDSAERTIYAAMHRSGLALDADVAAMIRETVWDGTFQGRFADRATAIRIYEEHNEAVRREVDPARLLEFEVAQGWEPLCDFLGVPVPATEFPRLNDSAAFHANLGAKPAAARR
jgi:hypothetical protein